MPNFTTAPTQYFSLLSLLSYLISTYFHKFSHNIIFTLCGWISSLNNLHKLTNLLMHHTILLSLIFIHLQKAANSPTYNLNTNTALWLPKNSSQPPQVYNPYWGLSIVMTPLISAGPTGGSPLLTWRHRWLVKGPGPMLLINIVILWRLSMPALSDVRGSLLT